MTTPVWNSKQWLERKHNIEKLRINKKEKYFKLKKLRSAVYFDTLDSVRQGMYETEGGETIYFDAFPETADNTIFYRTVKETDKEPIEGETEINVVNMDCILAGLRLKEKGFNPVVLNMASASKPGGGVLNGSISQEEHIFRTTNIFQSLYKYSRIGVEFDMDIDKENSYPLPVFGGIYSPDVIVFREGEDKGYKVLDDPFILSFVSVAAFKDPKLTSDGKLNRRDREGTRKKIESILRIALHNGHDSVVLSAFGCGAFHNPPKEIAKLFHEVLNDMEFKNRFRNITFAIIEDANSIREDNKDGNLKPFIEEFEK